MAVADHLGGYITGGDSAGWYPRLWEFLVAELGVGSVLDVGCGDGQALGWFRDRGCSVHGIDGVAQDDPDIHQHDFVRGPLVHKTRYDLCWCCEFVEHVERRRIPNFLTSFQAADLLLMTHATPGQAGHHHVNCQPSAYWIALLEANGFEHDQWLTVATRELAYENVEHRNYYARTGLAFRRRR